MCQRECESAATRGTGTNYSRATERGSATARARRHAMFLQKSLVSESGAQGHCTPKTKRASTAAIAYSLHAARRLMRAFTAVS